MAEPTNAQLTAARKVVQQMLAAEGYLDAAHATGESTEASKAASALFRKNHGLGDTDADKDKAVEALVREFQYNYNQTDAGKKHPLPKQGEAGFGDISNPATIEAVSHLDPTTREQIKLVAHGQPIHPQAKPSPVPPATQPVQETAQEKALGVELEKQFGKNGGKVEFKTDNGHYFKLHLNAEQSKQVEQISGADDNKLAQALGLKPGQVVISDAETILISADVDPAKIAALGKANQPPQPATHAITANERAMNHALSDAGINTYGKLTDLTEAQSKQMTADFNAKYGKDTKGHTPEQVTAAISAIYNAREKGHSNLSEAQLHQALQDELKKPAYNTPAKPAPKHDDPKPGQQEHHFVSYGDNGTIRDSRGEVKNVRQGDIGVGAVGEPVRDLQTMLAYLKDGKVNLGKTGYNTHDGIDNDYGKLTADAVRAYQHEKGLPENGTADETTRKDMIEDFQKKWNAAHPDKPIEVGASHITDKNQHDALHSVRVDLSQGEKKPDLIASIGGALTGAGVGGGKHVDAPGAPYSGAVADTGSRARDA